MSFQTEPSYQHGSASRSAIVLVNLGTPDAPTRSAVRRYLKEFLSDPRVVEIPRAVWWFILNLIILPFRSGQSAAKYQTIWTPEGSPLKVYTAAQAKQLEAALALRGHRDLKVVMAMRYGSPALPDVLKQLKADGINRIAVLPAYPQYSGTTTGSIYDAAFQHYGTVRNIPELRFVRNYHDNEAYIHALRDSVLAHWDQHGQPDKLVLSFHGVPKRTLMLGDPYHCECLKTARLLAAALQLTPDQYMVTFQSRFGKAEWLQPYTAPTVAQLARDGVKRLDVLCPGFTSDCLETLEEISLEVRHEFEQAGGQQFHYIPCLNDSPAWIAAMAEIIEPHLIGWPTRLAASEREAQQIDAQASRAAALARGATD